MTTALVQQVQQQQNLQQQLQINSRTDQNDQSKFAQSQFGSAGQEEEKIEGLGLVSQSSLMYQASRGGYGP
jgi:hypothetical protein